MAQRSNPLASQIDVGHAEELDLLDVSAVELLDHLPGVRTLDLEALVACG